MKRLRASLAWLSTLTAMGAFAVAAAPSAQAAVPRHLYVCITGGQAELEILRYRLDNRIPESKPDLIYPGVFPPMTVGIDGTLYANVVFPQSPYMAQINIYPPGKNVPSRTVFLPSALDYSLATALAVGPDGFLYAGYVTLISGASPQLGPSSKGGSPPLHGIAVFGPHANAASPPLLMYKFVGIEGGPTTLVMGPERDLYAGGWDQHEDENPGHIFTIAQPWQGANVISRLTTLYIEAIAFSQETRDLYALQRGNASENVLVYHRGAHGTAMPFRSFTFPGYGQSLAIVGDKVYVNTDAGIFAYPKGASGSPHPVFTHLYAGHHTLEVIAGP